MSYQLDLSGRAALVTGASSGLGAQFAQTRAAMLASKESDFINGAGIAADDGFAL